jgi:hypothetical protein
MSFYATFLLAFFNPVQRGWIDVTIFLNSSGPEGRIDQDVQLTIVGFSRFFADCPTEFCYQCVPGIEVADTVVPGQKVFEHRGHFQQMISKSTASGIRILPLPKDSHFYKRVIQLCSELPELLNKWQIFPKSDLAMNASSRWPVRNQGKGRDVISPIGMLERGIVWLQMRNSKPVFGQALKGATSVRIRTDRLPNIAKFLGSELFFPLAVRARRLVDNSLCVIR